MGLFGIIFRVVAAIVLIVVGLGAYLYFTDANVQAKITDRGSDAQCPPSASSCEVTATPNLVPFYHYKTQIDRSYWRFVCVGYQVDFHLQTHKLAVHDAKGTLVYDSEQPPGLGTLAASAVCGASNGGV